MTTPQPTWTNDLPTCHFGLPCRRDCIDACCIANAVCAPAVRELVTALREIANGTHAGDCQIIESHCTCHLAVAQAAIRGLPE